tara:strand:- start:2727 stop:3377 length:651 start_codon:yes stop_codon:yes gene_type:complete
MKLKLEVPASLDDVSLRDYKHYLKIQDNNKDDKFLAAKMIEIFCNAPLKQVLRMKLKDTEKICKMLEEVFKSKPVLVKRFKVGKTEYGFHPSLDDLSLGEYIDLDTFVGDWDNIEKAMNVLYRPIKHKFQDRYSIKEYNVKIDDSLLDMPMSAVTSSVFFLMNLGLDLSKNMTNYLDKKQTKALTEYLILEGNGGGINQFTNSLEEILQDLKISQN